MRNHVMPHIETSDLGDHWTDEEREAIVRACNSHEALKTNAADSRWLLRELLPRCKDPEWRARIEAQIGASDTALALVGGAA